MTTMPMQAVVGSNFRVSEMGYENSMVEIGYSGNQITLPMPVQAAATTSSDSQVGGGRKRRFTDEMMEKTIERRQRRMIKNRESAARSRARKQAYTNQLEHDAFQLRRTNDWLKKQKLDVDESPRTTARAKQLLVCQVKLGAGQRALKPLDLLSYAFSLLKVSTVQMEVIANQALLTCARDTLSTLLTSIAVVVNAEFQDSMALLMTNGPKGEGEHHGKSQSELVDVEGEAGRSELDDVEGEDGDENANDIADGGEDGGLGGGEEDPSSEEAGGYGNNPNINGNAKNEPEGGAGGAGEENGEDKDDDEGQNDEDDKEDNHNEEENDDDDDEEEEEDGEDVDEEEVQEEEEPEDDEEEDEDEASLQPPKKRKK
ncbi:unnamed protein product [Ilex paraguariensis]|uniref:BZIP domain-containing protein n=2 Tax=Ilex paraguariensis TaxID=185542 RepID=A0ABC8T9G5_9AQUA